MKPKDQTVWVRLTPYGGATLYPTEAEALDDARRVDRVFACRMVNWEEVEA